MLYIEETGIKLGDRFHEHLGDVKKPKTTTDRPLEQFINIITSQTILRKTRLILVFLSIKATREAITTV